MLPRAACVLLARRRAAAAPRACDVAHWPSTPIARDGILRQPCASPSDVVRRVRWLRHTAFCSLRCAHRDSAITAVSASGRSCLCRPLHRAPPYDCVGHAHLVDDACGRVSIRLAVLHTANSSFPLFCAALSVPAAAHLRAAMSDTLVLREGRATPRLLCLRAVLASGVGVVGAHLLLVVAAAVTAVEPRSAARAPLPR